MAPAIIELVIMPLLDSIVLIFYDFGEVSQKYFRQLLESCAHADKPDRPEIVEARKAVSAGQP